MITNLKFAFNFVFIVLFAIMLGCKKQEMLIPSESRSIKNTLHSAIATVESESLLAILGEGEKNKEAAIFYIKKNVMDNIIIYNQRPGFGLRWSVNNQYLIIDENEKEFKFTTLTVFGTKTETGLRGKIRILRDGKQIFSNQLAPIFTIEGTFKVLSPSAVLEIKVNKNNNVIIENCNPGYGLNKSWWSYDINYLIMDEDGKKFKFTSATTFPAKTITSLSGNKLKIMKDDNVLFDNLPELKPLFTIQEERSYLKVNFQYPAYVTMAILDIKINSNGNIVIDNKILDLD